MRQWISSFGQVFKLRIGKRVSSVIVGMMSVRIYPRLEGRIIYKSAKRPGECKQSSDQPEQNYGLGRDTT